MAQTSLVRDSDRSVSELFPGKERFDRAPFINLGCLWRLSHFPPRGELRSTNRHEDRRFARKILRDQRRCEGVFRQRDPFVETGSGAFAKVIAPLPNSPTQRKSRCATAIR